jgi:hypothetical protein
MAGVLLAAWLCTAAAPAQGGHGYGCGAARPVAALRCGVGGHACNPRWYYLWIDFREWMMK